MDSKCIESYIVEATLDDFTYSFLDKSSENTKIDLTKVSSKEIKFLRRGDVFTSIDFILNHKTKGIYKNNLGLEFEFDVLTNRLMIENNKILIEYDYFYESDLLSKFKIILLIK